MSDRRWADTTDEEDEVPDVNTEYVEDPAPSASVSQVSKFLLSPFQTSAVTHH
jgi:hypothetical protein